MKDSRAGEALWSEWSGANYTPSDSSAFVFHTIEHVDVHNDVVKRALASSMQRDGITDSLGEAFRLIESKVTVSQGYCGHIDEDTEFTSCDIDGKTFYGDYVDEIFPATWVEISVR